MEVRCIKALKNWHVGEVYTMHEDTSDSPMQWYLDCPAQWGYESGKWGFFDLEDYTFTNYFEIV